MGGGAAVPILLNKLCHSVVGACLPKSFQPRLIDSANLIYEAFAAEGCCE